jgi:hypothetical protein
MSKGSRRRPAVIDEKEMASRWAATFSRRKITLRPFVADIEVRQGDGPEPSGDYIARVQGDRTMDNHH